MTFSDDCKPSNHHILAFEDLCPEVQRWLATTKAPPSDAAEVLRLLQEDRRRDLNGTRAFQDATGRLYLHGRTATLTVRKFRTLP